MDLFGHTVLLNGELNGLAQVGRSRLSGWAVPVSAPA